MDATSDFLNLGSPKFLNTNERKRPAGADPINDWRETLSSGTAGACKNVNGDFAVGLREPSGRTQLAVDRFATRTLCYRRVNGELRFAARADELADSSTEVDPQAIFDYLFFHAIPSPRTIYKDIYRLPPAHHALFEDGKLTVSRYWKPEFTESKRASFKDLKDEFRGLLHGSVAGQLGDHKPACFLSGGTDSSTIAGLIGRVQSQPTASYSIGFDVGAYDEMAYARLAANQFNTQHHEYYVTPDDLVRSIPKVAAHYDQPFGNSSSLPAYYCARMAQADGVTKILAGDGGDELFGGNTRYAKQRVFGWYQALPQALRTGVLEPLSGLAGMQQIPLARKVASYVEQARVRMPDRLNMYNLLTRLGFGNVLTADFLSQIDQDGPAVQQRAVWDQSLGAHALNQNLAFDWRYTLAENDLAKVCGTTNLAGIQVGFPFLDQQLVDFSLRLPAEYKLKGLKLRWFFKEALRDFLPIEIIKKQKHGFGLPFGIWALRDAHLKRLAVDSLNSLGERGLVRKDFIHTLLTQRLPEHPGYYGEMVWILMMLEQWLQQHAPNYRLQA